MEVAGEPGPPRAGDSASSPSTPSGFVFGTAPSPEPSIESIQQAANQYGGKPIESAQPPSSAMAREIGREPVFKGPDYLMPPETDYPPAAGGVGLPTDEPASQLDQTPTTALPAGTDSTQVISPVTTGVAPVAAAKKPVICPECYASNTEQNMYCQECGNPLALRSLRTPAPTRASAIPESSQQTAVMPAEMLQEAVAQPAYSPDAFRGERVRNDRSFGAADVVAIIGTLVVAIAMSPIFSWKKGLDTGLFSHQGAFSQGRIDLLGGPGILPYSGAEFFTVGLIVTIALGLGLVFLFIRVGRGPMFVLAGSLLLFPLVYLFFQGVLPLRQSGFKPALGLNGILFGNTANPGAGTSLWLISAGGLLLILAGFLAPPRGWGRLFTFMLFFSLIVGGAFLCAVAYNWNILISQPAVSGTHLAVKTIPFIPLMALP